MFRKLLLLFFPISIIYTSSLYNPYSNHVYVLAFASFQNQPCVTKMTMMMGNCCVTNVRPNLNLCFNSSSNSNFMPTKTAIQSFRFQKNMPRFHSALSCAVEEAEIEKDGDGGDDDKDSYQEDNSQQVSSNEDKYDDKQYILDDSVESFNMDLLALTMEPMDQENVFTETSASSTTMMMNTNNLQRAEDIVEVADELYNRGMSTVKPNSSSYTTLIAGYAYYSRGKEQKKVAGVRAQRILDIIEKRSDLEANELSYAATAVAWCVQSKSDLSSWSSRTERIQRGISAVERAESCLYRSKEVGYSWDVKTCTEILSAWAKQAERGSKEAALRSREWLQRMETKADEEGIESNGCRPNLISYTTVLHAYASTRDIDQAEKAEQLLLDMEKSKNIEPDVVAYSTCMNAYAKAGRPDKAEKLLYKLEELHEEERPDGTRYQPNAVTYTTILSAYSHAKSPEKAESILERMQERYQSGYIGAKPTTASYNAVLNSWARVSKSVPYAAVRAESILNLMEQSDDKDVRPDVRSYSEVILAYSTNGCDRRKTRLSQQNALKCFSLLQRLEDANDIRGKRSNVYAYTMVISALGSAGLIEKAQALLIKMLDKSSGSVPGQHLSSDRPNEKTYYALMKGWARCQEPQKVEEVLNLMEKLYVKCNDQAARPSLLCYNIALNCWAKAGLAKRSLNVLHRMETIAQTKAIPGIFPDIISYNTCMYALVKTLSQSVIEEVEDLLTHMHANGCKPDAVTFNTLLSAYGKHGSRSPLTVKQVERVNIVLETMKSEYNRTQSMGIKPTEVTYNAVINALAKSKAPNKAKRSQELLHELKKEKTIPNLYVFTSVLNACSYTKGDDDEREEALSILFSTFQDLRRNGLRPNHITYHTLLRGIANLMPNSRERDDVLVTVFGRCANEGQVSGKVFYAYKSAVSSKQFQNLQISSAKSIPLKWRRNIRTK